MTKEPEVVEGYKRVVEGALELLGSLTLSDEDWCEYVDTSISNLYHALDQLGSEVEGSLVADSTKRCPECGDTCLVLFRDTNEKACINHTPVFYFPWHLDEGQKPMHANARSKRKIDNSEGT